MPLFTRTPMLRYITLISLFSQIISALTFHSYEEAKKLQKHNHKIIMLDIVRTHCKYCIYMDQVFQDKELQNYINKRFIPVKLNLDHDTLPLKIKVHFTPTFIFIIKSKLLKQFQVHGIKKIL